MRYIMQIKKYVFLKKVIKQMNMKFELKIATTNPDIIVTEQLKVATQRVNQKLQDIDHEFSQFSYDSLVSRFQRGDRRLLQSSKDFQMVYNTATLAEQMTNGLFSPYFAGKYEPGKIVETWALGKVFKDELVPLLKNPEIFGVWLSNDEQVKVATKQESDFNWSIDVHDLDSGEVISTYYLQNGVISQQKNDFDSNLHKQKSDIKQAIIVGNNTVEAGVWALVATFSEASDFISFVEHYNLSGLLINKENETLNFNDGSIVQAESMAK